MIDCVSYFPYFFSIGKNLTNTCLVFRPTSTFSRKLTTVHIENMRITDGIQYVIAKSDHRYLGFDLNDEIEQGSIYSIIQCNDDQEILSGWMVSKVMSQWVESYSQWSNYEEEVIPQSVAVYKGENNNDNSIANTEDCSSSKSDTNRSETSEDSLSYSSNPKSPPRCLQSRK